MTTKIIPTRRPEDLACGNKTCPAWQPYAAAVGIVAAAVALPMVFMPSLGPRFPFITLFPAVILAALFGGLWPGVLATLLSYIVADYFWIEPVGAFGIADPVIWWSAGIFVANGLAVSIITSRMHQGQARLAENMASIVNSSDDAIIGKTLGGTITSWNPGAERLFGYTAAEAIGQPILMLVPPECADEEPEILAGIAHGENIRRFETIRLRKDGTRAHVSVTISPIRDSAGKVIGASKVARDISAGKQAEAALRSSEIRYRRLFEAAKDGVLILDGQTGQITDANPHVLEVLGRPSSEVVGLELWEIGVFADATASRTAMAELQDRGYIRYDDLPLETKTGQRRDVEVVANVYEENGQRVIQCNIRDNSERTQAEEKLRESELATKRALDYAEATLRTSPVPFLVLRADLRVNTASEAFYTDFHVGPAETEGRLIYEIGNGQWNIPKLRELLEGIIPKKNVFNRFEMTHEFATIGSRTMLLNARRVDNAEGVPDRILLAIEDITERRQAEEMQARLGAIVSSADDGILSKSLDGVVTSWNASAERLFGYTAEEIIGNPGLHLTPPDLLHEEEHILEQILADQAIEHFETHRIAKDGRRLSVSLTISPIKDATGKVVGASKIVRDITERKRAEEAMRESEERFRTLADNMAPLAWMADADGALFWYNQRWFDYTGTTFEEMQGWGWKTVQHPEHVERVAKKWQHHVEAGTSWEDTFPLRGADGTYRWFLSRALAIRDKNGKLQRWFGSNSDITEQRAAADALEKAKDRAEAASNAKDNFLATLSHELRTPLTPVLMTAAALSIDPTLPAEAREQLDMMRRNIELEARLIDDLLDLTRIIHGKLTIERISADIHELLLHTDEIIRSDCLGKNLRITLKLDAARHHALGDPTRLQQVFWNLLRNAVKFTPDGGTITVSTRNDAEGKIIISVVDDGIGIRTEVLAEIFDAFEQADTTGEHQYGGLGLGLAISSAIVTAHGGEIKAESQGRGHGAGFTVTLGSVPAPAATSQRSATPAQPARALSLLVVEDHEATRTVLQRLLTSSGHLVVTASSVHDALTTYKSAHFDAVISDLGLPDGSGMDLMVQIQSIRPVPAIALSGYGMEDDLHRSKEAGFFAHLVKPVKLDQLKHLLTQIPISSP